MTTRTAQTAAAAAAAADRTATGLVAGTRVLTLQGALPVEYLSEGDRIITRSGARVLRRIEVVVLRDAAVVHVAPGALGHDRPDAPLCLPAGQPVLLRDWRAKTLYGAAQAAVPVGRLADGEFLREDRATDLRLFRLVFDSAEVVYAEGVEVAFAPETVAA